MHRQSHHRLLEHGCGARGRVGLVAVLKGVPLSMRAWLRYRRSTTNPFDRVILIEYRCPPSSLQRHSPDTSTTGSTAPEQERGSLTSRALTN
jgi:hypothetical protein